METVTITFWLTMLAGLLTFAAAWLSCPADARVGLALEASKREPMRNVRVRPAAPWMLSRESVETFLTLSRARAAQQGRPTHLHTKALERMGACHV